MASPGAGPEQYSTGPALQHSEHKHKHRHIRGIKENYFKGLLKEKHSETDMPINADTH